MKYEYNYYISRGRGFMAMKDEDASFTKDITAEKAKAMMDFLRELGYVEGETTKTIWFNHTLNSNENEEYIFYK